VVAKTVATELAERVRQELRGLTSAIDEKRMFGGTTFLLDSKMLCCVSNRGLMARVGKAGESLALSRPFAQHCMGTGRRMPGFVLVGFEGVKDSQGLLEWLAMARSYVDALPTKEGRARRPLVAKGKSPQFRRLV